VINSGLADQLFDASKEQGKDQVTPVMGQVNDMLKKFGKGAK
jgi:hypothetical protein